MVPSRIRRSNGCLKPRPDGGREILDGLEWLDIALGDELPLGWNPEWQASVLAPP